jgi:hypothetical protein
MIATLSKIVKNLGITKKPVKRETEEERRKKMADKVNAYLKKAEKRGKIG